MLSIKSVRKSVYIIKKLYFFNILGYKILELKYIRVIKYMDMDFNFRIWGLVKHKKLFKKNCV